MLPLLRLSWLLRAPPLSPRRFLPSPLRNRHCWGLLLLVMLSVFLLLLLLLRTQSLSPSHLLLLFDVAVGFSVLGVWCLWIVLGAWRLALGAWRLALGAWFLVLGACCLVLGAW